MPPSRRVGSDSEAHRPTEGQRTAADLTSSFYDYLQVFYWGVGHRVAALKQEQPRPRHYGCKLASPPRSQHRTQGHRAADGTGTHHPNPDCDNCIRIAERYEPGRLPLVPPRPRESFVPPCSRWRRWPRSVRAAHRSFGLRPPRPPRPHSGDRVRLTNLQEGRQHAGPRCRPRVVAGTAPAASGSRLTGFATCVDTEATLRRVRHAGRGAGQSDDLRSAAWWRSMRTGGAGSGRQPSVHAVQRHLRPHGQ